jgi:RNA-directed DNA polymerase
MTSYLETLKLATTRTDVANILKIKPKHMAYLLYVKPENEKYKIFQIPKKSGGTREIHAPHDDLKDLQRSLADILLKCVDEISVALDTPNTVSHGFMPGRSIFTNAYPHRQKRYVFNVDLKDFFGTITFPRVRGFLMQDRNFELHKDVATVVAQIACHQSKLPQGSPCSPIISNLIGQILDLHLVKLAAQNGCVYTRYADDLTFSTNKRNFPSAIAKLTPQQQHFWSAGRQLRGLITKSGFELNDAKTRMHYKASRQEVTGLITNVKVNVRTEYRHDVRAKVHHLIKDGNYFLKAPLVDDLGQHSIVEIPGSLEQLHGRLGHIHTTDKFNWAQMTSHRYNYPGRVSDKGKYTGNISVYRRFLLYKLLYANPKPLLICEGKTDNIYLAKAIHSLHEQFPTLTELNEKGQRVLSIRLFKYTDTSTGEILGNASGGTANLAALMRLYHEERKKFCAPPGSQPVVFVIDNDKGPIEKLYPTIQKIQGTKPTGVEVFFHVFANVYVVATPADEGTHSCMEDFFTKEDKKIEINGKKFDPSTDADTDYTYSKSTFAYKVVEKNPDIKFDLFAPLLQRIADVVSYHHKLATTGAASIVNS